MNTASRNASLDMTHGNITKHLLQFAFPLLIGNIFQQLYNTVDTVIVGNFVGKEALAAVGSTGPIINMLIALFNGLAVGATILISQYFGAHDKEKVHITVQTTMTLTFWISVVLSVIGVLLVPVLLRLMQTPADVFEPAKEYLQIFFAGLSGLIIYNMAAGILRAVGDSKRPLYFLILCTLMNTGLDLLFVAVFPWGIAGAAWATVISQFVSAILVLIVLTFEKSEFGIRWKELKINGLIAKQICKIGLPSALQMALTSFSNVFVQSYINRFGSACMAGWSSFAKIDSFASLPLMSISQAITTFVGQNIGAGQLDRAKKGTKVTVILGIIVTVIVIVPIILFAAPLIKMFNQETDVIYYGKLFIHFIMPFHIFMTINQCIAGSLRGAGATKACMFITLGSYVVFRQIYLFIAYRISPQVVPTMMAYPAGWILGMILILIYYFSGSWHKNYSFLTE